MTYGTGITVVCTIIATVVAVLTYMGNSNEKQTIVYVPSPAQPPSQTQEPRREPVRTQIRPDPVVTQNDDCSNPWNDQQAMMGALFGSSTTRCSFPATHCCFPDGTSIVLSTQLKYGQACQKIVNTFGISVPTTGMGCRR